MGMFKKLNVALDRAVDRLTWELVVILFGYGLLLLVLGLGSLGLVLTPQDDVLAKAGLRWVQLFAALFTTVFLACCTGLFFLVRGTWRHIMDRANVYIAEATTPPIGE